MPQFGLTTDFHGFEGSNIPSRTNCMCGEKRRQRRKAGLWLKVSEVVKGLRCVPRAW